MSEIVIRQPSYCNYETSFKYPGVNKQIITILEPNWEVDAQISQLFHFILQVSLNIII